MRFGEGDSRVLTPASPAPLRTAVMAALGTVQCGRWSGLGWAVLPWCIGGHW